MITEYDLLIKNAIKRWLPSVDWRLLKAQLQTESCLNPTAKSPVGAMGIAQFMPETWEQIKKDLNYPKTASAYDPDMAINASAFYMNEMYIGWTAKRPEADRYCLALASYNAGFGNILKAQRYASNVNDYYNIITQLHLVTGDNATETKNYVTRIFKTFCEYLIEGR